MAKNKTEKTIEKYEAAVAEIKVVKGKQAKSNLPVINFNDKECEAELTSLNEAITAHNEIIRTGTAKIDDINAAVETMENALVKLNKKRWEIRYADIASAKNPMLVILNDPCLLVYSLKSKLNDKKEQTAEKVAATKLGFIDLKAFTNYCNEEKKRSCVNGQWVTVMDGIKVALALYSKKIGIKEAEGDSGIKTFHLFEAETAMELEHVKDMVSKNHLKNMMQFVYDCWLGEGYTVQDVDVKVFKNTYLRFANVKERSDLLKMVTPKDATIIATLIRIGNRIITNGKYTLASK